MSTIIPREFMINAFNVNLLSNTDCVVEGARGIIEYTQNTVILNGDKFLFAIYGDNLEIKNLTNEFISITGDIKKIEYQK